MDLLPGPDGGKAASRIPLRPFVAYESEADVAGCANTIRFSSPSTFRSVVMFTGFVEGERTKAAGAWAPSLPESLDKCRRDLPRFMSLLLDDADDAT
jgi:hypothetical protein